MSDQQLDFYESPEPYDALEPPTPSEPTPGDDGVQKHCDYCGGGGASSVRILGVCWHVQQIRFNGANWICKVCRRFPDHGMRAEPQATRKPGNIEEIHE